MESSTSQIEAIRADIVNSMQWSDYEEEEEELYFCFCVPINFF